MRFSVSSEAMNEKPTCSCFREKGEGEEKETQRRRTYTPRKELGGCKRKPLDTKRFVGWRPGTWRKIVTPEYSTWTDMRHRCNSPNHRHFQYYGGRGILICNRWAGIDGFENFLEDMGKRPSPKHSLDRINPNGNYSPENCRWATRLVQANNMRNNHKIDGKTLRQYAEENGLDLRKLRKQHYGKR